MVQYPHCDSRILHAPGVCKYCDQSGLQEARKAAGIAFTGCEPGPGEKRCPAEEARSLDMMHRWPGNRPRKDIDALPNPLEGDEETDE